MNPDWTNARSADGPIVVDWVATQLPVRTQLMKEDPFSSVVCSWDRPGRLVGVFTLDEWLTPVGVMLNELPDECWRWAPPKTPTKMRETAERLIGEYMDGKAGRNEIARANDIPHRTVRKWIEGLDPAWS